MFDVIDTVGVRGRARGHVGIQLVGCDARTPNSCATRIGDGSGDTAGYGLCISAERALGAGDKPNEYLDAKRSHHWCLSKRCNTGRMNAPNEIGAFVDRVAEWEEG
jgi:hypothetical protein